MPESRELPFDVVDVFGAAPFTGNQLAVVHDTEGLSDAGLLAIAREFNFSETTFPGIADEASYPVRIFTVGGEIPFAGHPTLGTAWVLRSRGLVSGNELTQVCGAGDIGVRFASDEPEDMVELTATPRDLAGPLPDDAVAELLDDIGLGAQDRAGDAWIAGAGLDFVHLPVLADAVGRARPARGDFSRLGGGHDLTAPLEGVNLVAVDGSGPELKVNARVFVPGVGVGEDPATGSAAAGLGIALVAMGVLADGGSYEITQGGEMGRPSRLFGRVEVAFGVASRVHVAGQVFPVATGTIAAPRL
ncbi:MAG: PhzF family phenazine biosynthesis protein [Actinomycetota bacterium]|nr:PhzF family phenazine biosynthesis protein [Actinomycetota bacterium]